MNIKRVGGLLALALLGVAVAAEAGGGARRPLRARTARSRSGATSTRTTARGWSSLPMPTERRPARSRRRHAAWSTISRTGRRTGRCWCSPLQTGQALRIFTVKADGTGLKHVSPPSGLIDYSLPSFAPDGRHITFTRASGGIKTYQGGDQIKHSDVVEMDLDGKHLRVLARAATYQADYEFPMLSPDGSRFLYEHRRSHFADTFTRRRSSSRARMARSSSDSRRGRWMRATIPTGRRTGPGSSSTRTWTTTWHRRRSSPFAPTAPIAGS